MGWECKYRLIFLIMVGTFLSKTCVRLCMQRCFMMAAGGVEVRGGVQSKRERLENGVQLIHYSVTISWSEWTRGFMWDERASAD